MPDRFAPQARIEADTVEHLIEETEQGLRLEVKVHSLLGLHARPAARLVQEMQAYEAEITVTHEGSRADAKSILDIMALGATGGSTLLLHAHGPDARSSLLRAAELFSSEFKV